MTETVFELIADVRGARGNRGTARRAERGRARPRRSRLRAREGSSRRPRRGRRGRKHAAALARRVSRKDRRMTNTSRWRLACGVAALAAAAIIGIVGYLKLSLEPSLNHQLPYLASAGMAVIVLSAIGVCLVITDQLHADDARMEELAVAIQRLAEVLGTDVERPAPAREYGYPALERAPTQRDDVPRFNMAEVTERSDRGSHHVEPAEDHEPLVHRAAGTVGSVRQVRGTGVACACVARHSPGRPCGAGTHPTRHAGRPVLRCARRPRGRRARRSHHRPRRRRLGHRRDGAARPHTALRNGDGRDRHARPRLVADRVRGHPGARNRERHPAARARRARRPSGGCGSPSRRFAAGRASISETENPITVGRWPTTGSLRL